MATQCSMFDLATDPKITDGLREVLSLPHHREVLEATPEFSAVEGFPGDSSSTKNAASVGDVLHTILCSACQSPLANREEQMEHYKLDWHRFNLKQRLAGRPPFTIEEFEKKTGAGDLSSISGSDSEDEEPDGPEGDESTASSRSTSRVVFQNSEGQLMCLYRWAVQSSRVEGEVNLVDSLLKISDKTVWVVLMAGGGHFAGAVFQGKEILLHKTFHRYTVRAKHGSAQGLRDAQNRGHTPKSAGAALRRYNEAALVKDIQDLLKVWSDYLKVASAIFLRAPQYNRSVFYGGRGAPLEKNDTRIRSIPFATRRATFSEIKRVHNVLSTIHIYGKSVDISSILNPLKRVWQKKLPNPVTQKNPNTEAVISRVKEDEQSSEDEGSVQLEMVQATLGTLDLREHEVKPSKKKPRKRKNRKTTEREVSSSKECVEPITPATHQETSGQTNPRLEPDEVSEQWEYSLRDALYTACKTGDTLMLRTLLQSGEAGLLGARTQALQLLNTPIDSTGFTLLHVASAAGQREAARLLLDTGSDPACRDTKGQTPYTVTPDKDTRNMFRKYMAEHPEKYDYRKAQIPGPLTAEIESKKAEKKKTQKIVRKQREKAQKEERERQEQEEEEKRKFLELSDAEKRALTVQQAASAQIPFTTTRRCWQCGASLLGKVPFEYLDFSFCTPRCVQAHRKANAASRP